MIPRSHFDITDAYEESRRKSRDTQSSKDSKPTLAKLALLTLACLVVLSLPLIGAWLGELVAGL